MTEANQYLRGKRIIITGAASGIGRATARAAADAGATLALVDRNAEMLDELARELPTHSSPITVPLDVSDEAQVERVFGDIIAEWAGLDILINVAGIMRNQKSDIRDISLEDWRAVQNVNLTGSFLTARAASRAMIPAEAGVIILVGSPAGVTGGSGSISYGASKGGVNGLAMTLQGHLGDSGIRVHNFCPGSVDTPLFNQSLDSGVANGASQHYADSARAASVSADGIGRALALLASPLAEDLTGAIFTR